MNERAAQFAKTLKRVEAHNERFARGEVGYQQGLNQNADKFDHELKGSSHEMSDFPAIGEPITEEIM